MDKFFENMDKRFNSIESELDYNYSNENWQFAEKMLDDSVLDNSFIEAAQDTAAAPNIDFNCLDDAFLDDAFIEASSTVKTNYAATYFTDFKSKENTLFENETFVSAANSTKANYESAYWNAANIALKDEGLHHEYKSEYWNEAEKLLNRDTRNGFFFLWSSVAAFLILFSVIGLNFNTYHQSNETVLINKNLELSEESQKQSNLQSNKKRISSKVVELNKTKRHNTNLESNRINSNTISTQLSELIPTKNQLNKTTNGFVSHENTNLKAPLNSKQNNNSFSTQSALKKDSKHTNTDLVLNKNAILNYSFLPISKIKERDVNLVNTNTLKNDLQFLKITLINIKPIHELGLKFEKGLGNVFTDNKTTFSSRNALYIDYRFKPVKRLRQFEFGIETGAYHMSLNDLEFEQTYSVHKNHGGVDHMWAKMTYKDLVYLSSSINLFYRINSNHKIKIAFGLDKLITSKIAMKYKSNLETIVHNNINGNWGINKGINTIDITLGIGYEYEISRKFSLLFDTKFGTVDKTNNSYLRNTKMNRDFSILLGLKYNIFATH